MAVRKKKPAAKSAAKKRTSTGVKTSASSSNTSAYNKLKKKGMSHKQALAFSKHTKTKGK